MLDIFVSQYKLVFMHENIQEALYLGKSCLGKMKIILFETPDASIVLCHFSSIPPEGLILFI